MRAKIFREAIKTIERLLVLLGIGLFLSSLYLIFSGRLQNGVVVLGNVFYWSAFYLMKRGEIFANIERIEKDEQS